MVMIDISRNWISASPWFGNYYCCSLSCMISLCVLWSILLDALCQCPKGGQRWWFKLLLEMLCQVVILHNIVFFSFIMSSASVWLHLDYSIRYLLPPTKYSSSNFTNQSIYTRRNHLKFVFVGTWILVSHNFRSFHWPLDHTRVQT